MAIAASPTNFHDSIRSMFTSSSSANSTGSIAYQIESLVGGGRKSAEQQQRQNGMVLKMMAEQTKLLKKIAEGSAGGLSSGISTIDDLLDIFAHGKGKFGRLTRKLKSIVRLPVTAMEMLVGGVGTAFGVVAAAGKNILKPLIGLKNLFAASGITKVFGMIAPVLKVFPKLLGKLMLPITIIMGIADAFSGWSNAKEYLGKLDVSFGDKIASTLGTVINGLLLGIPNWLIEKFGGGNLQKLMMHAKDGIYNGVVKLGVGIGNVTGKAFAWVSQQISDIRQYLPTPGQVADMAWAAFDGVKTAVWNGLTYIGTSIKDGFYDFFKSMGDAIKEWWKNPFGPPPEIRGRGLVGPRQPGESTYSVPRPAPSVQKPQQQLRGATVSPISYEPSYRSPNSVYDVPGSQSDFDSGASGGWRPGMGAAAPDGYGGGGGYAGSPGGMPNVGSSGAADAPRTVGQDTTNFKPGMNYADVSTVLVNNLKKDYGLTDEQAFGVVGNFAHESAGFTAQQEGNPRSGRGGYGFAQWTGPRRRQLEAFAQNSGRDINDYNTQYDFLKWELANTEKGAIPAVKNATNRYDAVQAFEQNFERAGVKAYGSRNRFADRAAKGYTGPMASPIMTDGKSAGAITDPNVPSNLNVEQVPGALTGWHGETMKGDVKGLVIHHTGGRDTTGSVTKTLNQRGLSVQYFMDRDGNVKQFLPDNAIAKHTKKAQNGSGLSNDNAVGIEISGMDNNDITPKQVAAAQAWIADMQKKHPGIGNNIFGHGEINNHKQETEGMAVVNAYRARQKALAEQQKIATPTTQDMAAQSTLARKATQQAPVNMETFQKLNTTRPEYDPLAIKNAPAQALLAPVNNPQNGGVSADGGGNKTGPYSAGDLKVKDVPPVDEFKMMMVNGSAVT